MGLTEMRYIQYPPGWQASVPLIEFYTGPLPAREKVEQIFMLHRRGYSVADIAKAITSARSRDRSAAKRLITRVLDEGIALWDWVDDDVAIQRALDGDREVWRNLTWFERNEVMDRMSYYSEEHPHRLASGVRRSPGQQYRTDNIADGYVSTVNSGSSSINGYVEWAFAVGEEPVRIIQNMSKRKQRRHQKAYEQRRAA